MGSWPIYSIVFLTSLTYGLARSKYYHLFYFQVKMLKILIIYLISLLYTLKVVLHFVDVFLRYFYQYQSLQSYLNLYLNILDP